MTSAELTDVFVQTLVRRLGGTRRAWRIALGPVRLYDLKTHPHCNWAVTPSGTPGQIEAIETVADDLRAAHPIVSAR